MKSFILLVFCSLMARSASLLLDIDRVDGVNGWNVPNLKGIFSWIGLSEALNLKNNAQLRPYLNTNKYILFTRENPTEGQEIYPNEASITSSSYNPSNPCVITIHGYASNETHKLNSYMREAYFSKGDYNMITVDWSGSRLDYPTSSGLVSVAGKGVADLVKLLLGLLYLELKNFTCIGHSLGAHVCGFAAKNIESGKPAYIIGCDPARPLFPYDSPNDRLCSTDALFTESVQTDAGGYGYKEPIGQATYYPNGGDNQPGCESDPFGICDHGRCVDLVREAKMFENMRTKDCASYTDALAGTCSENYGSVVMCKPSNLLSKPQGAFYFPTYSQPPYSMS